MGLQDKDIVITPNRGSSTANPTMRFTGGNATVANSINVSVYADGTLSFEGTAGQLFSITNSLSGTIFSVNDVSGIPSIEVTDGGTIRLAQYNGNVGIGTATVTSGTELAVFGGNIQIGTASSGLIFPDGSRQTKALKDWVVKTSNYTAVDGDRIIANTAGGTFTVTLPAGPTTGTYIQITDGADWSAINLSVAPNGSTIEGVADSLTLNVKGITVDLLYDGATWEVVTSIGAQGPTGPTGPTGATGPTGPTGPVAPIGKAIAMVMVFG